MTAAAAVSASEAPAAPPGPDVLAGLPAWASVWLAPVHEPLRAIAGTADKPVAELTMTEVLAWAAVLGYAALTGFALGRLAANLALAALADPVRLRR